MKINNFARYLKWNMERGLVDLKDVDRNFHSIQIWEIPRVDATTKVLIKTAKTHLLAARLIYKRFRFVSQSK